MMDFNEVSRRIAMKQCDCGTCEPMDITHAAVAEPVLDALRSAEGNVLLTAPEVQNLGLFIERQAEMLDDTQEQMINMHALIERGDAALGQAAEMYKRLTWGLCVILGVVLGLLIGGVQRMIL